MEQRALRLVRRIVELARCRACYTSPSGAMPHMLDISFFSRVASRTHASSQAVHLTETHSPYLRIRPTRESVEESGKRRRLPEGAMRLCSKTARRTIIASKLSHSQSTTMYCSGRRMSPATTVEPGPCPMALVRAWANVVPHLREVVGAMWSWRNAVLDFARPAGVNIVTIVENGQAPKAVTSALARSPRQSLRGFSSEGPSCKWRQ